MFITILKLILINVIFSTYSMIFSSNVSSDQPKLDDDIFINSSKHLNKGKDIFKKLIDNDEIEEIEAFVDFDNYRRGANKQVLNQKTNFPGFVPDSVVPYDLLIFLKDQLLHIYRCKLLILNMT